MPFSDRLRRLRKAANLTQEQLALACGWSGQSRVGNYEKGDREPSLDDIPLLATALGVEIADLFSDNDKRPINESGDRDQRSTSLRLDPSTLALVRDVLDAHFKAKSLTYDFLADPEMLGIAYAFVADPKDTASLLAFTSALEARFKAQGEIPDGQAVGVVERKRVRKGRS